MSTHEHDHIKEAIRVAMKYLPRARRIEVLSAMLVENEAFADCIKVWEPRPVAGVEARA